MGQSHALSGAAAWLASVPLLTHEPLLGSYAVSLTPAQIAGGAVVCAGAAMLPDIDHHKGTISNTLGPITRVLTKAVAKASGGHRQATHSILFAVAMGIASELLATHFVYGWWVLLFLIVALGLRGAGIDFKVRGREVYAETLDALLAAGVVFLLHGVDMRFVGYAVFLGCIAHVAGDCLTPRGCPVFWPVKKRIGVPLIPRTDGKVERWVIAPLLTLAIVVLSLRSALGDRATDWLT
ncbi:metal-dependent hydrolase [Actinomadura craniellae]|uniref:Metal-dependent hydrolase n=2 Tax=Actinomadura craniellae TaxID=2231787 RepID=A0A365H2E2_9ACTN|nr:metal-dependent hydrolase [Actinomadura craniellae]